METMNDRIFKLMRDGQWHVTSEIVEVGGCSGMRRLQEMRQAIRAQKYHGIDKVEQRRCLDKAYINQFEYRFVGSALCTADRKITKCVAPESRSEVCQLKQAPTKKMAEAVVDESPSTECEVASPTVKKPEKKLDRESLIVERKNELDELSDRSHLVPVRSLKSSKISLEGVAKEN